MTAPTLTNEKNNPNQLTLPFDSFLFQIWDEWFPMVKKWHKFQDFESKTAGNCFDWWRSRYSEWIQSQKEKLPFNELSRKEKLFAEIWMNFQKLMTR